MGNGEIEKICKFCEEGCKTNFLKLRNMQFSICEMGFLKFD